MNRSLPIALSHIRQFEGGFVDHPRDPGGATNLGITLATYRRHLHPRGTVADLKRLTWAEAEDLYRRAYWDAVQGDALPAGLDLLVFDMAVNAGPGRAVRLLQGVLDVDQDGEIGPVTLAAVGARDPLGLIGAYSARRLAFYKSLKTWHTFGKGWSRRVEAAHLAARRLALPDPTPPTPSTQKKSP